MQRAGGLGSGAERREGPTVREPPRHALAGRVPGSAPEKSEHRLVLAFLLPFPLRGGFALRAFALRLSAQGLCVETNMIRPGRENPSKISKARQDHIRNYDETNRMVAIRLSKAFTNCACNSLDTLALEAVGLSLIHI